MDDIENRSVERERKRDQVVLKAAIFS